MTVKMKAVLSLFNSTVEKRVFQYIRALAVIMAYYVLLRALHGIEIRLILVYLILIVLPFLPYEYKDQRLVKQNLHI